MSSYSVEWVSSKERASVRRLLLAQGWALHTVEDGDDLWQSPLERWRNPEAVADAVLVCHRHGTDWYAAKGGYSTAVPWPEFLHLVTDGLVWLDTYAALTPEGASA